MSAPAAKGRRIVRVVKVGGSLFDWPRLALSLRCWLDAQRPATNVLIAGGGAWANAVRQADGVLGLGEEPSHWLCVDVLGVTARMLATLLGKRAKIVSELTAIPDPAPLPITTWLVFDVREFLHFHESNLPGCPLRHTWSVTSDSIAARVAQVINADELVLLKSAEAPPATTVAEMAAAGYVDPFFPTIAAEWKGPIRFVNLRASSDASSEHVGSGVR